MRSTIKIALIKGALLPLKSSVGAAGWDLRAMTDGCIIPGDRLLVDTGVIFEIPQGWAGFVRPRSGLGAKKGLSVIPGTIDSDYRGTVKIILHNLNIPNGKDDGLCYWRKGDRLAQIVFTPVFDGDLVPVPLEELTQTKRGAGGFGSTGIK